MCCLLEKKDDGVVAVLYFHRENLLYDIGNACYVEGGMVADPHVRHMVQDVCESGNVDRVSRVLDLAVAECREMLFPYSKDEISRFALDDRLKEQPLYGIVLRLPSGFSQTTLNLLEQLLHELLVCRCMADWLGVTLPERAANWGMKAEEAAGKIRSCLVSRTGRTRIKLHWI